MLETQIVLRISKQKLKNNFLEPGAFSVKQFCENYQACNCFAIWLIMLIYFLNDLNIQYTPNYEIQSLLEKGFCGHPL